MAAGLAEARRSRTVRAAVILVAVVASVWGALDEYTPLLIRDTGVGAATVPLFLLLIWAGAAVGGLLAGHGARLSTPWYAALLVGAAATLGLGALTGHPAGIVAVAVAFGAFQLATVVADTRLQHSITGPARATVTSVLGVLEDLSAITLFACFAVGSRVVGFPTLVALLAFPAVLVALAVARWLPATPDDS